MNHSPLSSGRLLNTSSPFTVSYQMIYLTYFWLQAEELNIIVGNAFKMAYTAQLQKQTNFQDVIASQLDQMQTDKVLWVSLLVNK